MKAFIFTHPPDYEISYLAYDTLLKTGVEEVALVYEEGKVKPKAGYQTIATSFPRLGNLNGPAFMKGALQMYLDNLNGHEEIMKVDSDTLVFDLDWTKHPETLIGFKAIPHRPFYGMAYTLKAKAIPLIQEILAQSHFKMNYPEDMMIEELCRDLGVRASPYNAELGPYAGWNWLTRKTPRYYRDIFSVINVYRPAGFTPENARKLVYAKMKQLIEAK